MGNGMHLNNISERNGLMTIYKERYHCEQEA